ncbi:hypothetical protein LAA29_200004 [Leuconostoc carnosum]|nr:hypothetical protein LAA29_200004 [Leuconostoc carnosum]
MFMFVTFIVTLLVLVIDLVKN